MGEPEIVLAVRKSVGDATPSLVKDGQNRWWLEIESAAELTEAIRAVVGQGRARLVTISCVDGPAFRELLYHFSAGKDVLTIRCKIWKTRGAVESITPFCPAAELIEHEITELFGIAFDGNPRTTNMLLPDGTTDIVRPLSRKPIGVEARVDKNLLNILTTSSTTSSSRRVEKARESLGLPAKPPLCAIACPTTCAIFDVADKDGVVHRHAGLRKKEAGQ